MFGYELIKKEKYWIEWWDTILDSKRFSFDEGKTWVTPYEKQAWDNINILGFDSPMYRIYLNEKYPNMTLEEIRDMLEAKEMKKTTIEKSLTPEESAILGNICYLLDEIESEDTSEED